MKTITQTLSSKLQEHLLAKIGQVVDEDALASKKNTRQQKLSVIIPTFGSSFSFLLCY
jgi:hypothetical protein